MVWTISDYALWHFEYLALAPGHMLVPVATEAITVGSGGVFQSGLVKRTWPPNGIADRFLRVRQTRSGPAVPLTNLWVFGTSFSAERPAPDRK